MPALDSLLPALLVAALVLVLLAFTFGTQRNIARGDAVLRWLQGSLPRLGRRTTVRWLGSSVVELVLAEPEQPFREITILAVMEPRDVPLLWAMTRARGRRDLLIFRASLRRAPRIEIEVSDPHAWITAPEPDDEAGWHAVDWPGEAAARIRGGAQPETTAAVQAAWVRLQSASGAAWRLSVRQTVPHLEVQVRPPDLGAVESAPLIDAFRGLAGELEPQG